jgi:hypothetical protein
MKLALQIAVLIGLASANILATENWSGYLVDSRCYQIAKANTGAWNTTTSDRDMDSDIRQCRPNEKTKFYALVQFDWKAYEFYSPGDAKAAEFVRSTNPGRQGMYLVRITGSNENGLLAMDSIAMAK